MMVDLQDKHFGAHAELKAVIWLLEQGYDVFRNVSPHGKVDLVAIKDGEIKLFDVKRSYRGGCPTPGVEHLSMMDDGSFKIMGARQRRNPTAMWDKTPRAEVLRKLKNGLD